MNSNKPYKRYLKNLIINPKFQFKYLLWVNLGGIILTILYTIVFYVYIRENYQLLVEMVDMTDAARNLLYSELNKIIFYLIACAFFFLIVITIWGVFISHKVAGPLYKLKKVINEIKNGDVNQRVYFRENDEFKDVATAFNEMLDYLQKR
ncbi:MAG: HAMP domain-containing protein [Oligoflexia bacterium]|nr:HAMP domain-containing protein [Oligoflexia bacterium]